MALMTNETDADHGDKTKTAEPEGTRTVLISTPSPLKPETIHSLSIRIAAVSHAEKAQNETKTANETPFALCGTLYTLWFFALPLINVLLS
jgi:hypothetical protein